LNHVDGLLLAEDENVKVRDLMDELVHDSNDDTLRGDDPILTLAVPPSCTVSQQCISLASLFSFAESTGIDCLQFYWKGGLRNLEHEVAAYDLLQGGEDLGVLNGTERHSNTTDSGTFAQ
jgi:hypothetical protein